MRAIHPGVLCATALALSVSTTSVASTPVSVFLLAGQSNMDGRDDISYAPPEWSLPQEDVLFYYRDTVGWVALQFGSATAPGTPTSFGPELSFGRLLADTYPEQQIALLKHAKGGTSLESDWAPGAGPQYLAFADKVTCGLAALELAGYAPTVRGMIWMQGETDARVLTYSQAYEANLTAFIAAVRAFVELARISHEGPC